MSGKSEKKEHQKKIIGLSRKGLILTVIAAVAVGASITIGLNRVYMQSSTDESCQSCHVHPQADKSWKLSSHHNSKSGVAHFLGNSEEEVLMGIRELLSFLPSNNLEDAPARPAGDDVHREDERLTDLMPSDPIVPYDVIVLIESVADDYYFYEIMPHFAKNVVIGFVRMGGRTAGIVANQPAFLAGVLDIDASDKAARFIRFCDYFNIPIITLEDVPGFLPGCTQEHNGIIRHLAKIVYAYIEATVPKITLILRKA